MTNMNMTNTGIITQASELRIAGSSLVCAITKERTKLKITGSPSDRLRTEVAQRFIREEHIELTQDVRELKQIQRDILSRVEAKIIKTSELNAISTLWFLITDKRLTQEI